MNQEQDMKIYIPRTQEISQQKEPAYSADADRVMIWKPADKTADKPKPP